MTQSRKSQLVNEVSLVQSKIVDIAIMEVELHDLLQINRNLDLIRIYAISRRYDEISREKEFEEELKVFSKDEVYEFYLNKKDKSYWGQGDLLIVIDKIDKNVSFSYRDIDGDDWGKSWYVAAPRSTEIHLDQLLNDAQDLLELKKINSLNAELNFKVKELEDIIKANILEALNNSESARRESEFNELILQTKESSIRYLKTNISFLESRIKYLESDKRFLETTISYWESRAKRYYVPIISKINEVLFNRRKKAEQQLSDK